MFHDAAPRHEVYSEIALGSDVAELTWNTRWNGLGAGGYKAINIASQLRWQAGANSS